MKAVIDTNVLLVANGLHDDISPECVIECINSLLALQEDGVIVIDDGFRILGEYMHKTSLNPPIGVGDKFLKWLLRHSHSESRRVDQIPLKEINTDFYAEFPDPDLEPHFDAPDRKFAAVAYAHPEQPTILQAADCKWLDWWQALQDKGVIVYFLCPSDACSFYRKKFPDRPEPVLPASSR